ncbi:phage replisome organizer N-terminal domain-containing protein [Aliarcobacter butzleri]|uniref:phage replisome organizer N-terminal domain-containing protein n=1 Tax=Aliarcobacter butzleri TaxID=28197 RepID=UPI0021B24232|nr:phage replisome organizer N-terminal domain-containing protein [Aliarcobacter butzleri]MCT7562058.1 phage replisome organizer N-terminal domain-containing protein [Aliarcobacter butzleri]
MAKKYYWLKLKEDFFERDEIKIIESQKNGKDYINFYFKLLLKSLKTDGTLRFRDAIPYNLEMLSTITNCNVDTVNTAINTFIELGLMEKWEDGTFFMLEVQNMVGSETSWAEKKREYRNKKTMSSNCLDNIKTKIGQVRQEIEIDIDIDIDIDAEKHQKLNEILLQKQISKDKQKIRDENLSQQTRDNQIIEI